MFVYHLILLHDFRYFDISEKVKYGENYIMCSVHRISHIILDKCENL
jgi:hypothetical protein